MWDKVGPKNKRGPWLLEPANFTPPGRTPWGGRRIVESLKVGVEVEGPVGESWELSVEPDFPSRIDGGPPLEDALREAGLGSTSLLVKLVDAEDDLSLQIHPHDDDPALEPTQSGKPEAWYILAADPGAGLYLGFKRGATADGVADVLRDGAPLDRMMYFVPVSPGDVFVVEPGTPHAIGKGVLLLEPQRVEPGKRGVTYRYWDWNRKYDADGRLDPNGAPRELHTERALEVTRWDGPRESELLDRIRHRAGAAALEEEARLETLCSEEGPLVSSTFFIERLSGTGSLELPKHEKLTSLTVFDGEVRVAAEEASLNVTRGRTAALPPHVRPVHVELDRAHAVLCSLR
jgi:mannose-6-phosphate isomerase